MQFAQGHFVLESSGSAPPGIDYDYRSFADKEEAANFNNDIDKVSSLSVFANSSMRYTTLIHLFIMLYVSTSLLPHVLVKNKFFLMYPGNNGMKGISSGCQSNGPQQMPNHSLSFYSLFLFFVSLYRPLDMHYAKIIETG